MISRLPDGPRRLTACMALGVAALNPTAALSEFQQPLADHVGHSLDEAEASYVTDRCAAVMSALASALPDDDRFTGSLMERAEVFFFVGLQSYLEHHPKHVARERHDRTVLALTGEHVGHLNSSKVTTGHYLSDPIALADIELCGHLFEGIMR